MFDRDRVLFTGIPDDGSNRPFGFVEESKVLAWLIDNKFIPTVEGVEVTAWQAWMVVYGGAAV